MKHWWVVTPEYGEVIPILDDGSGPMEYQSDVVCVDAPNKRAAKVAAVRRLRDLFPNGWLRDHDANPFTGLKAEPAECKHGKIACDCERRQDDYCEECEREHMGRRGEESTPAAEPSAAQAGASPAEPDTLTQAERLIDSAILLLNSE